MNIFEKVNEIGKTIAKNAVIACQDFSSALDDTSRICDANNRINSVSSGAFCRAFSNVVKQICYARTNKFADTYCSLADEAIEMLVSGTSEADVLWHFDKMLIREMRGDSDA